MQGLICSTFFISASGEGRKGGDLEVAPTPPPKGKKDSPPSFHLAHSLPLSTKHTHTHTHMHNNKQLGEAIQLEVGSSAIPAVLFGIAAASGPGPDHSGVAWAQYCSPAGPGISSLAGSLQEPCPTHMLGPWTGPASDSLAGSLDNRLACSLANAAHLCGQPVTLQALWLPAASAAASGNELISHRLMHQPVAHQPVAMDCIGHCPSKQPRCLLPTLTALPHALPPLRQACSMVSTTAVHPPPPSGTLIVYICIYTSS